MRDVIKTKVADMRRKKAWEEHRNISLRTMSSETGLSKTTLQNLVSGNVDRIDLNTLDVLCRYFGCTVADLVEYVPDTMPL